MKEGLIALLKKGFKHEVSTDIRSIKDSLENGPSRKYLEGEVPNIFLRRNETNDKKYDTGAY
jgi:hypothetical protein